MEAKANTSLKTRDMAYCALMSVLIAVCSWISLPIGQVPFTLQTFGVFCALGLLGGARGTIAIAVYILLGAVGVPVFAGFSGGLSVLIGTTGDSGLFAVGTYLLADYRQVRLGTCAVDNRPCAGTCGVLRIWHGVVHGCVCARYRPDRPWFGAYVVRCALPAARRGQDGAGAAADRQA